MRRTIAVVALLAVMGTFVHAQTTQVVSRNAVGYVKIEAPKGEFAMLRNDFLPVDGAEPTVVTVLGQQVPVNTKVYIWDPISSGYLIETRVPFGSGWSPATNVLDTGRGFWLQVPATAPSNTYTVFMMGEVPDRFTQPTSTVQVAGSTFSQIGYPYPVTMAWTNTALAAAGAVNDKVYFWNGAGYDIITKSPFGGWQPPDVEFQPGDAFWYANGGGEITWNEPKPYDWP